MAITQTLPALAAPPGSTYALSSLFSVTPGGDPLWLDLFVYDKSEYTAGISSSSFGSLAGLGTTAPLLQQGSTDIYSNQIVFQYIASQSDYYNATYGWLTELTYTAPTMVNANEYLEVYETNSLTWSTNPQLALDVASRSTAATTQATPQAICAAAQSFVGQAWNLNGCWVLASDIAATAGTSLPVTAGIADGTGIGNGQWVPVFQGATQASANWQTLLRPGDVVAFQWADTSGHTGSHTTTVVSGYGTASSTIDNGYLINADGQIITAANDGSAADIIIQAPQPAAQTFQWAIADTVTIYRLDTPIVTAGSPAAIPSLSPVALSSLFSVADPAGNPITAYQIYDTGTGSAAGTFMVDGQAETSHSADTPVSVDQASMAGALLVVGTVAKSTADQIEVRAYNGTYWGDWQAVSVTIQPSATIESFLSQQNGAGRGINGISPFVAGSPGGPTANGVVGWLSTAFASGYDAVCLSGPRNQYAVQVGGHGQTMITDLSTGTPTSGQTITVTGETYVIFDGAAATTQDGAPVYDQIYFIETPAFAQLAEFYAAVFQRIPDLAGLEYWENALAQGGSIANVAQDFLTIIHNTYATASPITTLGGDPAGMTSTQFLTDLYQNILGRQHDPGGLTYWLTAMANGASQAQILVAFTDAAATISAVNAEAGAVAGTGSGWLIAPSVSGGYADPGLQMAAQAMLAQAAQSNDYTLSLIDPATVPTSGLGVGGATLTPGTLQITAGAPAATIILSASFTTLSAANSGDVIHDGPGADSITVTGAGDFITVGTATTDVLHLGSGTNSFVFNFAPGHGSVIDASGTNSSTVTLLDGTTAAVHGSSLAFGGSAAVYVNIGGTGGGTPAEAVAAANKAYLPADVAGEHPVFLATDSAGDTQLWSYKADGAHQVDAAALTLIATLIGVPAANLTAADLA